MLKPGEVYGRLTILEEDHKDSKGVRFYKCQCSCPAKTIKVINGNNIQYGHTKSCGCMRHEAAMKSVATRTKNERKYKVGKLNCKSAVCKECGEPVYAKGLCKNCYEAERRGTNYKEYAYPMNLLLEMGLSLASITQGTKKRLAQLMDTGVINDKQKNVIIKYYRDRKTYDEIGKEMGGLSRERIRQVLNKGMSVLRDINTLDYVLGLTPYQNKISELKTQIKKLEYLRDGLINNVVPVDMTKRSDLKKLPLETIRGWSNKAYNGLRKNGVKTLYDLAKLRDDEYKHMKSVGINTWLEIQRKRDEYNLKLSS